MNSRLFILALGLLLLARPALAESGPSFALDLRLASPGDELEPTDGICRDNPYALYQRGCPDQLNAHPERYGERMNILDQLLVLADRYKDMNLERQIRPSTQLKFTMGLVNLYEQEAQARLALRIRF
jgi:hypothetical protein